MSSQPREAAATMVVVEQIGRVRRLTLNRPEVLNALSVDLQEELLAAIRSAEDDPGTHALVLRGAGRAFSAGYDMTPRSRQPGRPRPEQSDGAVEADFRAIVDMGRRWTAVYESRVPVIAQVHGFCLAGAVDLALHCDILLVAEDAVLGVPEVRSMGVPPTHMWIYNVGPQWAKRLLLTGDTISGRQAAEIGMALEAVPADRLEERALWLATRMALIGRPLLRANKDVVNQALELMGRSTLQYISAAQDTIAHLSPDWAEFRRTARERGLSYAFKQRDLPFQEGEPS